MGGGILVRLQRLPDRHQRIHLCAELALARLRVTRQGTAPWHRRNPGILEGPARRRRQRRRVCARFNGRAIELTELLRDLVV